MVTESGWTRGGPAMHRTSYSGNKQGIRHGTWRKDPSPVRKQNARLDAIAHRKIVYDQLTVCRRAAR